MGQSASLSPRKLTQRIQKIKIQYERDREEAENEAVPNEELLEPTGELQANPSDAHSVDKRRYYYSRYTRLPRRRYGFWVSAINKMDNGNLKSFLGNHRNIYNVYKRYWRVPYAQGMVANGA